MKNSNEFAYGLATFSITYLLSVIIISHLKIITAREYGLLAFVYCMILLVSSICEDFKLSKNKILRELYIDGISR